MPRTAAFTAAFLLTALGGITGCSTTTVPGEPAPQPSITPSRIPDQLRGPLDKIGDDFPMSAPPEWLPAPSKPVSELFGEAKARQGVAWCIAVAQQTAFDVTIWLKMVTADPSDPVTGNDYARWRAWMTQNGRNKWRDATGNPALWLDPVKGPGDFLLLPDINPSRRWSGAMLRPPGYKGFPSDGWRVESTEIGPASQYNNQPTLKVTFHDWHSYDYTQDGKPAATQAHRRIMFQITATGDAAHPWLLDDWVVPAADYTPTRPLAENTPAPQPLPSIVESSPGQS